MTKVDTFDRDTFAKLVADSCHWSEVSRRLGYSGNNNKKLIRERCLKDDVDYKHLDEKKLSRIWSLSDDDFSQLVSQSCYKKDIYRYLGYSGTASAERHFKTRVEELGLETSHFRLQRNEDIFRVRDRRVSGRRLKAKLLSLGVPEKCNICELSPLWKNKSLTLEVDHIDGNPLNNEDTNLQLLCPNCHSQTETYCGKNVKRKATFISHNYKCLDCGIKLSTNSKGQTTRCCKCFGFRSRKAVRPDRCALLSDIEKLGYTGTGNKYGVSDNSIRKWLRSSEKLCPDIKIKPLIYKK